MKFVTVLAMSFLAISAQARSGETCPRGLPQVAVCRSTPVAGDDAAAVRYDSITVCRGQELEGAALIPTKNGASELVGVEVIETTGSTNYVIALGVSSFRLSMVPGRPQARWIEKNRSGEISSTYTCK